jgi:hypothetical protein
MSDAASCEPTVWLATVQLEGSDNMVPVVLFERDGSTVYVRQVDPGEPQPARIPIFPGDQVVVMQAISYLSHHLTPEVGNTKDMLFGHRIIPVRRESGKVFARTLKRGEADPGTRVHARPGDQVVFEDGAIVVELDFLDDMGVADDTGYVALAPTLLTWLGLGTGHDDARTRYLLAAARRLDTLSVLFSEIKSVRTRLEDDEISAIDFRKDTIRMIGAVEVAIIALGRATDMVTRARALIGSTVPVPSRVSASSAALTAIRNAYEHIEDRSLGLQRAKPHADALTIFDYERLIVDNLITYGPHQLDLTAEVPEIIGEIRQFLKEAAANG